MIGYLSIGERNAQLFDGRTFYMNGATFEVVAGIDPVVVEIPSRNKEVHVFGSESLATFIKGIDSEYGDSYKKKLSGFSDRGKVGLVVNTGEHPSFATTGSFHYFGFSGEPGVDFLVFTMTPGLVKTIQEQQPEKYLLYRFGEAPGPVFVQAPETQRKWRKWVIGHGRLLAYNALERRLYK